MAGHDKAGSLQLDNDPAARRREWRFERAGWAMMSLVLIAGLCGAFGQGALARTAVATPDAGMTVRYERVARVDAPASFTVILRPAQWPDSTAIISVDRASLDAVEVQHVSPEPIESRALEDRVDFVFRRGRTSRSLEVVFSIIPNRIGTSHTTIGSVHGPVRLAQLVLP